MKKWVVLAGFILGMWTLPACAGVSVSLTPSLFAPALAVAQDSCAESKTFGGVLTGLGAFLGFTQINRDCEITQDAHLLVSLKKQRAALALLCQIERVQGLLSTARACAIVQERRRQLAAVALYEEPKTYRHSGR